MGLLDRSKNPRSDWPSMDEIKVTVDNLKSPDNTPIKIRDWLPYAAKLGLEPRAKCQPRNYIWL